MCYRIVWVITYLLLFAAQLEAGSYGDVYGAFPRQASMAGAVSSFVNNSSSPYYNVAGLARANEQELLLLNNKIESNSLNNTSTEPKDQQNIKSNNPDKVENDPQKANPQSTRSRFHEVSISYNYADPKISTNLQRRERLSETNDHYATIGLTYDLNEIYDFNRNVRFGLNIITPASGNILTINDQNPNVPRPIQSGAANERPTITGGLAVEVWKDHLYLGLGFTAFARGGGSILLKNVPISPEQTTPDQQIILQIKPIINPIFGAQFHWQKFDLGLSYRRETFLSVDPLPARAQTTLLGIQLDLDIALLDLYQPKVITGGVSYRLKDNIRLAMDVNLERWSEYKLSRTKLTYNEGPQVKDTTNVRLGLEYQWKQDISFRIGYARRPSAIGDITGRTNLLDFDRNIYTFGSSYTITEKSFKIFSGLKKAILLDFVIDYQSWSPREISKNAPSPDNPNFSYGGKALHFGFGVTTFL